MTQDIQHLMRPGTLSLSSLPPLSLYVHLPWCLKKCPYCDFNSHEAQSSVGGELPEQRYLDALCADLEHSLPLIWGRSVHSIFIGGGTPSLFSPAAIERLISDMRARLRLEADCEITLEANPGTFEKDRFRAFRAAGVTRLSVGVQSFNDQHLQALGRVHNRAQAIAAVEEARDAVGGDVGLEAPRVGHERWRPEPVGRHRLDEEFAQGTLRGSLFRRLFAFTRPYRRIFWLNLALTLLAGLERLQAGQLARQLVTAL